MNKIKCLVTGGSGFIGTNVIDDLIKQHNFNTSNLINCDIEKPQIQEYQAYWRQIDLSNEEEVIKLFEIFQPTHVLHLASILGSDKINDPELEKNILVVKNLNLDITLI